VIGFALLAARRCTRMQSGLIGSLVILAAAMLLSSCAQIPPAPPAQVAPFSAARPGGAYPGSWRTLAFSKFRKETGYALVDDCGTTVVEARAEGSSSGLVALVDIDPSKYPWLTWRWKVPQLVPGADNTRREAEDAPARAEISFDGDSKKLTIGDRQRSCADRDVRADLLGALDPPPRFLTIRGLFWSIPDAGHQSYCLVSQGHDGVAT